MQTQLIITGATKKTNFLTGNHKSNISSDGSMVSETSKL